MEYIYKPQGVCSSEIILNIEHNIIKDIKVKHGCDGNLKGISSLLIGMNIDDVIAKLKGIKCGFKNTSCPDQIAKALEEYKKAM
ncbi:MAG: TIGR03905 family TSCPD domain-containing protein [Clostridia bacterium]|nr:TIGR03905 family TSCPD domain-containing protein [Clostridia bacterium]